MREDSRGMVSILVTMIMIIVISLIVLGFAEVTRRNEQDSVNDQLSTQAYYAAESGVNSAVNYLTSHIGAQENTLGNCTSFSQSANITTSLNGSSVDFPCLMVDTQPTTLNIAPLNEESSTVLNLQNADSSTDGEGFSQLQFTWAKQLDPSFSPATCSGSGITGLTLPQLNNWDCPYGILRLDLADGTNISNTALENNQDVTSFYLVPSYRTFSTTTPVSWPPKTQPIDPTAAANAACSSAANSCPVQIIPVSCSEDDGCSITLDISDGSTPYGSSQYYARLSMMYQSSSSVTIAGGDPTHTINTTTGIGVPFTSGQALIDSTGQADGELRRIQVRIPLETSTSVIPAYGLQTTDSICKLITDGAGVPYSAGTCPS